MTIFLRLLSSVDKTGDLADASHSIRMGTPDNRVFEIEPQHFASLPGKPFAYWATKNLRSLFTELAPFESQDRSARVGLQTSDDFRFCRAWWECLEANGAKVWFTFVKGGPASKFYGNLDLKVNWAKRGEEIKAWAEVANHGGHWSRKIPSSDHYFQAGITWPLRASELSPYPMPRKSIFSIRGSVAFTDNDDLNKLLGLMSSRPFDYLFKLLVGRFGYPEFAIGSLQRVPVCDPIPEQLAPLALRAWGLQRQFYSKDETSLAFLVPTSLRQQTGLPDVEGMPKEIAEIQSAIDRLAFAAYGLGESDQDVIALAQQEAREMEGDAPPIGEEDSSDILMDTSGEATLYSWCVGVAFGRFDWRLTTGEREVPLEPDPFDPLPAKSPGMLPAGTAPFHGLPSILVDNPGHPHDLPRLIEDVLTTVGQPVPEDVRRWLRRDFFPHHLKQYSKSRRKAPVYWPLSTASGRYTLWLYYPAVTDQTLYTAANDFIVPKLDETTRLAAALRSRSDRSRDEERLLEQLQDLEVELRELQDELLRLAPTWKPDHDDGVQITAAPLWRLFRLRSWQTVLKETWEKLEKGDYDWAHLAMSYWPGRVREKCRTDKSLAIAHNLEELYEPPPEKAGTGRRGHKGRADAS